MRGKRLSGLTLVVVSLLLCLLSSPVISGEHPWDRDNGSGGTNGTTPVDTTIVRQTLPGSCGVEIADPSTLTQPQLSWQWQLVVRVTMWFQQTRYDAPVQWGMKRVQDRTGRN